MVIGLGMYNNHYSLISTHINKIKGGNFEISALNYPRKGSKTRKIVINYPVQPATHRSISDPHASDRPATSTTVVPVRVDSWVNHGRRNVWNIVGARCRVQYPTLLMAL